jgi:hypothetical protein
VTQLPFEGFTQVIRRIARGTSGKQANDNGRNIEEAVADRLRTCGEYFNQQQPVGTSIYNTAIRCDFYLPQAITDHGLCIEVKYQDTPGTADQKLPFLYQNIVEGRYPAPVLVLIVGSGWSPGALPWLRSKVDGQRLYAVMNFEEFLTWTIRTL